MTTNIKGATDLEVEDCLYDGFCAGYAEAYCRRDELKWSVFNADDLENEKHPYNRTTDVAIHALPLIENQLKFPLDACAQVRMNLRNNPHTSHQATPISYELLGWYIRDFTGYWSV